MALKVLITGGAGFIGTNLVRYLAGRPGYAVTVLDNLSAGQTAQYLPREAEFREGDFTDRATLAACLKNTDVVVHLAALSGVIDSIEDPVPGFKVNAAGSFQLLELARHAGVRNVIVASTGGALLGEVPPPISEAMAPSPMSPYGASKMAMEGYCSAFARAYCLACAPLRFSNIYGPFSPHKKSAVATFVKKALLGEPITVYGDGTQQRDYLFVGDLVRGIEAAITKNVAGTYQLGSGKPTSLNVLIETLEKVGGRRIAIDYRPARRGEVHSTWCDTSHAQKSFGFAAPTALAEGLEQTWAWFADNQARWQNEPALSAD